MRTPTRWMICCAARTASRRSRKSARVRRRAEKRRASDNEHMKRVLIKLVIILVVLGGLGYLFVRSAQNVRSEPYEVERARLSGWTLAIDTTADASGVLLGLVRLRPHV